MFLSNHYKLPTRLLFLNTAFYQMASRVVNPDPEKYRGPRGLLIDFDSKHPWLNSINSINVTFKKVERERREGNSSKTTLGLPDLLKMLISVQPV